MKETLPQRKNIRLKNYDYNSKGAYFLTICTKNREEILGTVGTGVPDGPQDSNQFSIAVHLSEYGKCTEMHLEQLNNFYDNISIDKYVIMPNHIHLLLRISEPTDDMTNIIKSGGTPTSTIISKFISTFKRMCTADFGFNYWQPRSNDHIVRDDNDYHRIWQYIDENPAKWEDDCFYKPIK